ncbi:MAG TPA: SDR family oxidoreductase [Allosphingosinicella sp.]|jgi:nucleoside-diphosphate-sugar epimerase|nr:SDR family oxidoreductase [Allosphingosinicella sp.]
MMETIVVTGGCGYIGCKLVPALLNKGFSVKVIDRLYFGKNLPDSVLSSPSFELVEADICDDSAVARALEGASGVIHLAAVANDPSAELDPELTRSVNLDASLALLSRAQASGVRRFVNASTATVYGVRDEPDVDESFEHRPITLYGKYKSETDQATAAANGASFVTVNLRSATVCGWSPRMRLDLTVNILTEQAKNRGRITVHGGAQKRPNIVVDDLVRAYLQAFEAPAGRVGGQSFNISASNRSVLEIAETVARVVNPDAAIEVAPIIDLRSYHISTQRAADVLGFRAELDVEDGARQVADAIDSGRLPSPSDARYRNVETLKAWSLTAAQ